MVMAKLHVICGNCGCGDDFTWDFEDTKEGAYVFLKCHNCGTIHNLQDNCIDEEDE
jgi:uncharacterized Zn finger protein